jgi:hypothetical protein
MQLGGLRVENGPVESDVLIGRIQPRKKQSKVDSPLYRACCTEIGNKLRFSVSLSCMVTIAPQHLVNDRTI